MGIVGFKGTQRLILSFPPLVNSKKFPSLGIAVFRMEHVTHQGQLLLMGRLIAWVTGTDRS